MISDVRDAATQWAFTVGWRLTKRMPEPAARAVFQAAADTMWLRNGESVQQLERNLARVNPAWTKDELRVLSKEGMRSYLRYWLEAFRLPSWSHERVSGTFDLAGQELMDEAVRSGTGAVMVPCHMANWDHAGAWGCLRFGGVTTVAERLKPEGLFNQFLAYRQTLGMDVLAIGEPDLVRSLMRKVKEGRILALLGDRDISRNGVEVNLFGEPAALPGGPALIGLLTGAPVYPVTMWFDGDRTTGQVYPAVVAPSGLSRAEQVREMTQQIAYAFEDGIRAHPTDWHMLQKVWLADLDPARRASSLS